MNRRRGFRWLSSVNETTREISMLGSSFHYHVVKKHLYGILDPAKTCIPHNIQSQRCLQGQLLRQECFGHGGMVSQESLISGRYLFWRFNLPCSFGGNSPWLKQSGATYCHYGNTDNNLSRKFIAKLWVADRKMLKDIEKRRRKAKHLNYVLQHPLGKSFSGSKVTEEQSNDRATPIFKQPPVSQSVKGFLQPTSTEEAQIAPLLARSNLLITRDIEWANLVLGIEQENRYAIVDVCYPQSPVGFIREQSNVIARQLLRLRRPFVAYITDAMGNELFRVHRPFWWITSSIYAEIGGKEVGVVHRRWHLWRRVYDLYLGNKQFAVVENPGLWNWTFTLKDIDGQVLAQIDRDWRGFGFEIFTDAGQYVIRFGSTDPISKTGPASMIQELDVTRPLTLSERAITVALAISLDNDYFSRHGGWGIPFVYTGE
ncbi:altered inheritance rate of mitochondria protein 25 [Durio zibethinus]|uniref:Phospholipid scramblase n=1 Tax=Durio zibethinus TaxID=66656 RepID=A0A6P5XGW8_DURZI|nr:altered inheritance rate of mitochondria protein 25 [Durio zibethinus]